MSQFFNLFANQNKNPQNNIDKSLVVKIERCPQNHTCPSVRICPVGALTQKGYSAPTVDKDKCIKCGKCVSFCPKRALVLE
ncbi:4Fe-4S binding protein [Paludicola sp. MB14-C6]|uniref:4Fe-4S dicluster domain-containing protein n=1 Tax=Paludihabitans sp. MB14-C6 TaxID=3070656 RepID=UPI0027DB51B1|nr:4Fe-4S binding protein [Paludicola sp. MB14-C6]WMJ22560.1 4Fe-4S binding protein [Paludicola sp. MB14-C6]